MDLKYNKENVNKDDISCNREDEKSQTRIFQSILAKGRNIYHMTPYSMRSLVKPLRSIYKLYSSYFLNVWIIKGKEISSGQELSIIFAGHTIDKNYFTNMVYGDDFQQSYYGKKMLPGVIKAVRDNRYKCSLAIVEVPQKLQSLSKRLNCFYVPSWITGSFDIQNDKSSIFSSKNSRLTSDISKIRKNKLTFEITHEITHLETFYYSMFEPYINKIYGDRKLFSDYSFVKREFIRQGVFKDLLLVKKDNEYIAGALLTYKDKWARISVVGVKDANMDYVRDGAIGALYYFTVQYFEEKGFRMISLGSSRPFLKDGVNQFKRKWKQKISRYTKSGFLIKMLKETEGSKGFLINNPFIIEDATGLNGAVFIETTQGLGEEDYQRFLKDYYQRGISKLIIYPFETSKNITECNIPSQLLDKIAFSSLTNI